MASQSKAHGSVIQTFRYSKDLLIRLEYNPQSQMQRVYFNSEQRSALSATPGYRCLHQFSGYDPVADDLGCSGSDWRVHFAVENGSFRIRYGLLWRKRNPGTPNGSWSVLDGNMTEKELHELSTAEPCAPVCIRCGNSNMFCYECDKVVCQCGKELICTECSCCPRCGATYRCQCGISNFDIEAVCEFIRRQDPELVRGVLVDALSHEDNQENNSWKSFAASLLPAFGYEEDEDELADDDEE